MDTPTSPQQQAINKSRAIDPALVRISKLRPGVYSVLGNTNWYEVTVGPGGYSCTCAAALHNEPACWHRASCYRLRLACRALKGVKTTE